MFRFRREKVFPLYLAKRITICELARAAGVSQGAAQRAVTGKPVSGKIIGGVAAALGIDPLQFVDFGGAKV